MRSNDAFGPNKSCRQWGSGSGTDRLCRRVLNHFLYWRLTGSASVMRVRLSLTRSRHRQ